METVLERYPFCGGEADLWAKHGKHGYFTFCQRSVCSATTKTFLLGIDLQDDWVNTLAAKRAVDAWNRRCKEDNDLH